MEPFVPLINRGDAVGGGKEEEDKTRISVADDERRKT
jgi:hypothetical protein